ncbi:hypothetical protein O1611_g9304 [Lasiodiplodia mahajangana]|uniref:Uncharacterized protein n=1 Tax=Lasiodiplodia mahajangana TaxID=1108764 RepID=A0ACC2JAE6_9PEZI|nr:hypothetical protein O1611_g9304 [Lasiodiplodia mahajangana]
MTPAPTTPQTTTTSVTAPWGCRVESTLTSSGNGISFDNMTRHIGAPPACKCRRNLDPKQENINEETVGRHTHKLWTSGKCDAVEMITTFAKLKLGLPVPKEFELRWDEEKKVWDTNPGEEKKTGESNDARSRSRRNLTFAGQVSSEGALEPSPLTPPYIRMKK